MAADFHRERIGIVFIDIDVSRAAAPRQSARPGRQRTAGGKVEKFGNPFAGAYGGTKELPVVAARTGARLFHSAV
jgi:hypothetical protein